MIKIFRDVDQLSKKIFKLECELDKGAGDIFGDERIRVVFEDRGYNENMEFELANFIHQSQNICYFFTNECRFAINMTEQELTNFVDNMLESIED